MRRLTKFTVVLLALLMVGGMFQPAIHAFSEVKIMSKDITEYEKANVEIFNQNDESLGTLEYEIKGKPIQLPFLKNIEILRIRAEEKTPQLINVKITVKIQDKIDEGIIKVAIKLWDNSVNKDISKETKVIFSKLDSKPQNENTRDNYNPIGDDQEQTEEPKQEDIPLTPLIPSEPVEPEQKDIPLTPLTPSEPVEPEQKDIPLTPLTPSEPVEPEQPEEPGTETPEDPKDPGKEEPQPQEPGKEEPQPKKLTDELLKEIIDKVSELLSENKEEKVDEYINSLKLSEEDKDKVNNLINELKEKLNKPKEEPQEPGKEEPQPEEPQDPGKEEPQPEEPQDPGKGEQQEPGDDKQQPEEPQEPGDKEQPEEPQEPGKEEPQEPGTENPGKEEPQPEEPQEPGTEEPGKEEPGKEEPGKEEPGKEKPQPEEPKDPEEKIVDDPSWDLGKRFNNGAIINKEEFRNEFLRLVNEKRAEVGVAPLKLGKHLKKGSDIRAKEMADHGSMRGGYPTEEDPENKKGKHMRPDGKESFRTAYDYLGNYDSYKGGNLGENILERYRVYPDEDVRREWIGTSKSLAKKCFDLWAASPGHLRNMVGSQYKTTWISVATDEVEDYKLFMIAQNVFDVCENDDPLD